MDKRTKNILYDVKLWVHVFSGSFGSVVDKRTRGELFGSNCSGGELSRYHSRKVTESSKSTSLFSLQVREHLRKQRKEAKLNGKSKSMILI